MLNKSIVAIASSAVLALTLAGCGGGSVEPEEPLNLEGKWHQVNADSASWMDAEISGDEISVDWVSDGGETTSIYWIGSYDSPTEAGDSYTWTSDKDEEAVGNALLASGNDTKEFSYENGELTFEVTAMGTTTTVHMERTEQ